MKKKIFLTLTILWTAFIFFNSLQVQEESAQMSGFFTALAMRMLGAVGLGDIDTGSLSHIVRKIAHFAEFFIQGALLSVLADCITQKYRYAVVYVLFAGLLTACCDEFIQIFVDGRGSAIGDVFIDFGGTVCAVFLFALRHYFFEKKALLN